MDLDISRLSIENYRRTIRFYLYGIIWLTNGRTNLWKSNWNTDQRSVLFVPTSFVWKYVQKYMTTRVKISCLRVFTLKSLTLHMKLRLISYSRRKDFCKGTRYFFFVVLYNVWEDFKNGRTTHLCLHIKTYRLKLRKLGIRSLKGNDYFSINFEEFIIRWLLKVSIDDKIFRKIVPSWKMYTKYLSKHNLISHGTFPNERRRFYHRRTTQECITFRFPLFFWSMMEVGDILRVISVGFLEWKIVIVLPLIQNCT